MESFWRLAGSISMMAITLGGCASDSPASQVSIAEDNDSLRPRRSDAEVRRGLEAAIVGYDVTFGGNEGDGTFRFVSAQLGARETLNATTVRRMFADVVQADPEADKPLSALYYNDMSFAAWKHRAEADASTGRDADLQLQAINAALAANLSGIHVYYFGRNGRRGASHSVEGINVSVFVLGRTESGRVAGLYSVVTWT